MEPQQVDVSVLMPTYNARRYVEDAIASMRMQRFDGTLEFLVIDGGSDDDTPAIVRRIAEEDPRIRLLHNPARRTPNALNIGLRAARGTYIARMDAHTVYPRDYLAAGVARLRRGDVAWVGGPAVPEGRGRWSRRVALALESRIGVGASPFRRAHDREIDADTLFAGIWERTSLEAYGGWDEGWPINQDGELAGRIRRAGGRILCLPEMAAHYIPRDSLPTLAQQYARYGFYKGKTVRRHPMTLRRSLLLPPAAVGVVAFAALPGRLGRLARAGTTVYAATLLGGAVQMRGRASLRDVAALPIVWGTMHLAWGTGFLGACVRFGPPARGVVRALGGRNTAKPPDASAKPG